MKCSTATVVIDTTPQPTQRERVGEALFRHHYQDAQTAYSWDATGPAERECWYQTADVAINAMKETT
jgi:hypothetical protein